jgi:prepilin-type N-terminal cleavage/methylation domain-containing protein
MLSAKTHQNNLGFSLLEMMIVVAIVLILAAVTVPRLMSTVRPLSPT